MEVATFIIKGVPTALEDEQQEAHLNNILLSLRNSYNWIVVAYQSFIMIFLIFWNQVQEYRRFCWQMIVESYKANVPAAQQSGITIWSLSDNEAEHEYWLKGQVPNLFDKDYKRKWAYKGFCDGIAGEDLGLKFGGDEYKAFYEKSNVSSSVDK